MCINLNPTAKAKDKEKKKHNKVNSKLCQKNLFIYFFSFFSFKNRMEGRQSRAVRWSEVPVGEAGSRSGEARQRQTGGWSEARLAGSGDRQRNGLPKGQG